MAANQQYWPYDPVEVEIIPLHLSEDFKNVFMVVVQLGAILAVVVLYFHKLNPFSARKKALPETGDIIFVGQNHHCLSSGGYCRASF